MILVFLLFLLSGFALPNLININGGIDYSDRKKFQIGIFYGPTPELTNDEQYRWIKAANIDFIQYIVADGSEKQNLQILDLAYKYGLTYFVSDLRVKGSDNDIKEMVSAYKNHPATAGYYIQDEPGVGALDWPSETYRKILALDPEREPYVNLLPDWVIPDYEKVYVEKWIEMVGKDNLKFLSFDHYPFMADGSIGVTYFNNLDIIRRAGLKYNVKTSSYLQSMGITGAYRRPTEHELRYSAYSNLAYGIKNLMWFTYNTPVKQTSEKFTSAIIDSLGNKTNLYEPFKKLNAQLKVVGDVLIDLDAVAVYHTGKIPGIGIAPLPSGYFWQPVSLQDELIISKFVHPFSGKEYVLVVNKSLTDKKEVRFKLAHEIYKVLRLSSDSGKRKNVKIKNNELTDTFLPGEGKLYQIDRKTDY